VPTLPCHSHNQSKCQAITINASMVLPTCKFHFCNGDLGAPSCCNQRCWLLNKQSWCAIFDAFPTLTAAMQGTIHGEVGVRRNGVNRICMISVAEARFRPFVDRSDSNEGAVVPRLCRWPRLAAPPYCIRTHIFKQYVPYAPDLRTLAGTPCYRTRPTEPQMPDFPWSLR
jgi:hypothetical protein